MKILLQFPEGLKQEALKYSEKYEKQGHEVYLSASPCYGACDLAIDEAKLIGAKKIIHFGHARFVKKKLPIPVEYIEYTLDFDVAKLEKTITALIRYKTVAIGTTVQYYKKIPEIKKFFESKGKKVLIGKGNAAIYDAQVLGCDAFAVTQFNEKADAILFIGDGEFHYLAIETEKPVFVFHPKSGQIQQINEEIQRLKKRRKGAILKAIDCKTFGIIISTKVGQFNAEVAKWARKELEKRGKKTAILVANELEPLSLNNFLVFDCYINTACPRLADDVEEFGKPVLTILMLKELLEILDAFK